jgi:saccharopine dehydrogenase (NAD+, L-lysine-forming)
MRPIARDLRETAPRDWEIVVGDYDFSAARALAGGPVSAVRLDVTDPEAAARCFRGAFAVINSVPYRFNVAVMEAALAAGAHYLDLGGLFHVTRKQLRLHRRFQQARLLALLGIGAAPGITNLLARMLCEELTEVREIHCQLGSANLAKQAPGGPLSASYSIETIFDEASLPAALFTGGRLKFVPAMSGEEEVRFPIPVGVRRPALTLHSEVATLPVSYRKQGVREVSFRIDFGAAMAEKLRFLQALGLLSGKSVKVGAATLVPRDLLRRLLAGLPPPPPRKGPPREYEVVRVLVRGKKGGRAVEATADLHCPGVPKWGVGVDADTGSPPSVAVQMLARGEIGARGALPPELAVPPTPFFRELARRGMTVRRSG